MICVLQTNKIKIITFVSGYSFHDSQISEMIFLRNGVKVD